MHTGGVDPGVVETEQRTDRDRVVDLFVVPSGGFQSVDIFFCQPIRLGIHSLEEREERLETIVDRSRSKVVQHCLDQTAIAQQFRRDRGV